MTRSPEVPAAVGRPSLAAVLLLVLSGCGLTAVEDARDEARMVARDAAAARAGASAEPGYVTVRRVDRPWVGLVPIEEEKGVLLPERLLTEDAVTLPLAGADDDAVLAARIEAATDIPVRFVGAAREDAGASFGATDLLVPNGAVWTGPLDRLLDAWTEAAGHEWRYADTGRIEIVRRLTAVFRVNALAGTERHGASSSTQDQAGEDGSSSLSAQSIESETVYDPWPEIEAQLAGLVGEETVVTVSPASASVTVSGAPADVRKVRGYLAWLNREVLRPVTLSVHLYAVRFERESEHGVDVSLSEMLGSSASLAVAGDTVSVIRSSDTGGAVETLAAAVRALSRAGTVSRVLSADIPSLNGKPAQFPGAHQRGVPEGAQDHGRRGRGPDRAGAGHGVVGVRALLPRAHHRPRRGAGETLGESQGPSALHHLHHGRAHHPASGLRRACGAGDAADRPRRDPDGDRVQATGARFRTGREASTRTCPCRWAGAARGLVREERVLLIAADIGAPLGISEVRGVELDQGVPLYRGDPLDQGVPL